MLHWSGAFIGNIAVENFAAQNSAPITDQVRHDIDDKVRRAAYRIIKGKGATWFGIGAGMARLAKAIINDENAVLTCSKRVATIEGITDVTLSLPQIVCAQGIKNTIYPELDDDEKQLLRKSAAIIKAAIDDVLG